MKKLLTLLMLLCTVCTGAWAEIQSSTLLNPVPYLIRNLNCGYIANDLSRYHANSTDTSDGYGQFIFIETGTANQYKIYELSTKRYFSAKANFSTSAKAQTELVENEQSATTWIITQKNSAPDKYTISPSTNTGAFLNFHGGTSDNGNINGAVGFHTNGSNDEGSFWLFEKCQYLPESPIKGKVYTIINDHKGVPYYVANTQTTNSIQDITAERSTNGSQEWICWNASSGGLEFVNVLDGQKLKSANNYEAFDIDDLRALVGFAVLGHNTMVHIAGHKNNNTLNGGIFTKKTGNNAVYNEYSDIWSTDFIFSPTGQQAYKLIVSGKDDATVTYSDQTRLNGGYFVFADEYTPQEGDFDFHAPTGYIAIFSVDTENNTITVNYTENAAPVKFVDGYYFIKNAGDEYATNDFNTPTETAFGAKVDAYNGMWKATYDEEDNTITINSGVGTPLYVGGNSYSELIFTGKHNGSFTAKSADDAVWTFEPVVLGARLVSNVTIVGDNGEGWLKFNHNSNDERAKDGGFFLIHTSNDFGDAYCNLTYDEIPGKNATIIVNGHNDITLGYASQAEIEALEARIRDVYPHLNTIGYPKYPGNEDYVAEQSIFELAFVGWGLAGVEPGQYAEFVQDLNVIYNATDVVLPTAGGFYDLTDYNGNTKTYYLTENNELLSYENGQFTQIGMNGDDAFVDYAIAGTTEGEKFEFSKSTAGFGKLAAWQLGEGPLPSGDGRINSGWTITKTEPSVKMNNINDVYYASMYMPTAVELPEGVEAYEGKISNDGTSLKLTQIDLGGAHVLAANTPVVLISESEISAADLTVSDAVGVGANENDFEGTAVTMPQDGTSTYYVLNTGSKGAGFYKYNATKNVNGFKAYYKVPAASASAFSFVFDEGLTTGLENAVMEVVKSKAPIYNLQGTRVINPVKGQIYIQNGKTIIY